MTTTPTLLATAESLKALLVSRATGNTSATDEEYKLLRTILLSTQSTKAKLPACVLKCRTVFEFWEIIHQKFKTYQERREFLRNEFGPLLTMLEEGATTAGAAILVDPLAGEALHEATSRVTVVRSGCRCRSPTHR